MDYDVSQDENSTEGFDLAEDIQNHTGISRSVAIGLPLRDSR